MGVSGDPLSSHEGFSARYRLLFTLFSDEHGQARRAFGVRSTLGILPGRATNDVDHEGTIRYVFSSQLRAREHVKRALEVVQGLSRPAT